MEIVTKVNCACSIKARLDENGELSIAVAGTVEYAPGRTATATTEVPPDLAQPVRAALKAALDSVHRRSAAAAVNAANQAKEVAVRMEEM